MIDLTPTTYLLAILGGLLAGVINTLAGSGSLVTLPILIFLGLPANVANGTNRVGIIIQCVTGLVTLRRAGKLELRGSLAMILPAVVGGLIGAVIASRLDASTMTLVIAIVLVVMLGLILYNPRRWLREDSEEGATKFRPWLIGVFLGIGLYGGFLQAGVGVVLLVALVVGAGFSLVHANGIKIMVTLCLNVVAIGVFLSQGLVHWEAGLLMSVGQAVGAWAAVRFLVGVETAALWTRRLLITVVVIGIVRFWGIWDAVVAWWG